MTHTGSSSQGPAGTTTGTVWLRQAAMGAKPRRGERIVHAGKVATAAGVSAGLDLGLWLAGQIAGREHAETIQPYIEYDPRPPFDAGHPSKASKAVIGNARTLGRKIAINPSEARAVPRDRLAAHGRHVPQAKGVVMNGTGPSAGTDLT